MKTLPLVTALAVALLAASVVTPHAQTEEGPPCWHPEFDAFSFLKGEWRVRYEDRLGDGTWEKGDARSWIMPDFDGCLLVERYGGSRAGKPFAGRAFYGFNSVNGRLQRMWSDSEHGMLTTYEGVLAGHEIVLDYRMVLRGQPVILRDVFLAMSADSFKVENRRSNDDGKTWLVTSKLVYVRAPAPVVAAPQPTVELPPELARVLTDYEAAWQKKDADALAALFAPDGFVLPGGQPPLRGRDAIRAHYQGAGGPLALRALHYGQDDDTAFIIGGYGSKRGEEDGGKFTLTLTKDRDGRWLIMSDMDSQNRR